jgi:hypothetical protein
MRFKPKYLWWAILAIVGGLSFFGIVSLPRDWGAAMKLLTSVDQWLFAHAAHPSLFALVIGLVLGTAIIPEAWNLLKTLIAPKSRQPNMKINVAVDYIVNDSATGVEHGDALRLISEKLATGELHAWGRREFIADQSKQYVAERRPIQTDYWELMALHPLTCFDDAKLMAQTITSPGPMGRNDYAGLMLCRDEVIRSFPKKNISRRAWEMIRRKPRITYRGPRR